MAILIDTGFFVALVNKDDNNHERADSLLEELLTGKWGARITTDYILDEAITVTWARTKKKALVTNVYDLFLGSEAICLLQPIPHELLSEIWEYFQQYSTIKRPLSFTDCSLLAYAKKKGIDHLMSFDEEFNGLISRIH